ncbi:Colon cancer-associated Mic1-like [Phytophthora cactorum]|nr:Colon cancer-associated Mic1-like [Phytophthora cactorum]
MYQFFVTSQYSPDPFSSSTWMNCTHASVLERARWCCLRGRQSPRLVRRDTPECIASIPQSLKLQQLPLDASLDPMAAATADFSASENLTTLYDFSEPNASGDHRDAVQQRNQTPIMLLQLSVDSQFLAIQRSDIEVQVLHRATRASYWVLCKSKAGNRTLHGGPFLITKLGLEHHRVSYKRRSCALHRTVGLYVHEFWYAASHGVLLVSSGSRANEVVPFLLHGTNAEKLPELVFSTSVGKQDLHLVTLYGDLYVVYTDTRSTKLLLYLVGRTKVTCVRSLNVMLPRGRRWSIRSWTIYSYVTVWSLTSVCSLISSVTGVSAIRSQPHCRSHRVRRVINTRASCQALPVGAFTPQSLNGREQVEIRKLQLNLNEICKTCEHHREILPLLLRRGDHESAKQLVLKLVRGYIVEHRASLSSIAQLLNTVQTVCGSEQRNNGIEKRKTTETVLNNDTSSDQEAAEYSSGRTTVRPHPRNARGFLLIQQTDFYRHVWSDILQEAKVVHRCDLSVYIVEYIKNLRETKVPVENITYVALAECFIAAGEPNKLYQFLHYHVLADSVELADLRFETGKPTQL